MTTIAQIILAIALVLSIILPFGYYLIGEKNRGRYKTAIGVNAFFFFGTMLIAIAVMFTGASSVQAAAGSEAGLATGMGYIAAALVTGLSCIGGGIAVALSLIHIYALWQTTLLKIILVCSLVTQFS